MTDDQWNLKSFIDPSWLAWFTTNFFSPIFYTWFIIPHWIKSSHPEGFVWTSYLDSPNPTQPNPTLIQHHRNELHFSPCSSRLEFLHLDISVQSLPQHQCWDRDLYGGDTEASWWVFNLRKVVGFIEWIFWGLERWIFTVFLLSFFGGWRFSIPNVFEE